MKLCLQISLLALLLYCVDAMAADKGRVRQALRAKLVDAYTIDPSELPPGTRVFENVAYGSDPLQTFDVYAPAKAYRAPVIFMVHGGGWRRGDKQAEGVVLAKVGHWLPRGFVLISTNYPLLPETPPLQQVVNVREALAKAQHDAEQWGANPYAFILMGHSAGAHLVSMLSIDPVLAKSSRLLPWLGTVALDSAAFDVVRIMQAPHASLYDDAFGNDPAVWEAASPLWQLHGYIAPFLAVCSTQRLESCDQASTFVDQAVQRGARARVLPVDLSHGEINAQLGLPTDYTTAVDQFIAELDPSLAALMQ